MTLWPQSLFWRLVGVMLTGLLVAQLLSAAINFAERDQLLFRSIGLQSAQRIADTVELLDSLNPAERARIVSVINVPPQVVSLDQTPMATTDNSVAGMQAGMFAAILHSELGDERSIRIAVADAAPVEARGPGSGYGRRRAMREGKEFVPGMYRGSPDHASPDFGNTFRVQVQLRDGAWVTFETLVAQTSASLPIRLLSTLLILLLAVLALSYLAVRWVTRPLHLLAEAADQLGEDIHRAPLPENGPREVKLAARAFNRMQSRLQRLIDDRDRIFSAMSHDLKTPITRLRLRAEMLDDDEQRKRFEKDLHEMEQMVGSALEFLRGLDAGQVRQPVDMVALLESIQADHAELGKAVSLEGTTTQPVVGMAPLLKRCLNNLIDNAIRYGGRARVILEDSPGELRLRIADDGPGIPEDQQEKVFEPFYRLEGSRSRETGGTGLGLCIARNIVYAHGGTLALRNRREGGLEVSVVLPRLPADPDTTSMRRSG